MSRFVWPGARVSAEDFRIIRITDRIIAICLFAIFLWFVT